jgi:flavodoxin
MRVIGTGSAPVVAIVYASIHHQNTREVAEVMAHELRASLLNVEQAMTSGLSDYDLVGLGSGIYFGRHHHSLLEMVAAWKNAPEKVFLFSTAGLSILKWAQHSALRSAVRKKGARILGEFCCRGWDTVGPLRFLGGINRKRPDESDLARAREFADRMLKESLAGSGAK